MPLGCAVHFKYQVHYLVEKTVEQKITFRKIMFVVNAKCHSWCCSELQWLGGVTAAKSLRCNKHLDDKRVNKAASPRP